MESLLMPFIDYCSLACGGHAGDSDSLQMAMDLAIKHKVGVGAHPSYPDREFFGRRSMDLPREVLEDSLLEQLRLFQNIASSRSMQMHHIKAHGALYNDLASDPVLASNYLSVLESFKNTAYLIVSPYSEVARQAEVQGFSVLYEVFADRKYDGSGFLRSRSEEGSLIKDPIEVRQQVELLLNDSSVQTDSGRITIKADTLCVHGDNPNALAILQNLRATPGLWTSLN